MQKSPCVSVVMPTHRRSQLMRRALQSILDQTYHDFEVIVVDDNSKGHNEQLATEKLIKQFSDPRIRYVINESSCGGAEARNVGIRMARGIYIAFLDDDEDWLKDKLLKQVSVMNAAGLDVGVIDTGFFDWKKNGKVRVVYPKMQGWIFERLLRKTGGRAPKLSTILCRKSAIDDAGLFDPNIEVREDLDLYIRLARHYRFESIQEPLSNKRSDAGTRLTGNPGKIADGFEGLYLKIKSDLEADPKTHAIYLLKYAAALSLSGRQDDAKKKYYTAFRLWPLNPRLITYGIKLLRS